MGKESQLVLNKPLNGYLNINQKQPRFHFLQIFVKKGRLKGKKEKSTAYVKEDYSKKLQVEMFPKKKTIPLNVNYLQRLGPTMKNFTPF